MSAKILLIENTPTQSPHLIKLLTRFGYTVTHATNGIDGLSIMSIDTDGFRVSPKTIRCVLLDLRMPAMSGLQFLKELRGREGAKGPLGFRVPVVFLSDYEGDEEWAFAINGGVTEYLIKPVDPERLRALLARIIENGESDRVRQESHARGVFRFLHFRNLKRWWRRLPK